MGKEVIRRAAKEAKREKVVKKANILMMVDMNMSGKKNGVKVTKVDMEVERKERVVKKVPKAMNMSGKKNGAKEVIRRAAKEAKREKVVKKANILMMVNMNMSGKKNGVKATKVDMEVERKERVVKKVPKVMNMSGKKNGAKEVIRRAAKE